MAGVEDGVVTLEASGSPGGALPLVSRAEAMIRAAVPEVTRIRVIGPGGEPAPAAEGDLGDRICQVLDAEINPVIAAHHGHVVLAGVGQGWVRVRLEGGCRGCSLAEVTLRQGIEPVLRARVPAMVGLIDVTEHEAGAGPFFSPAKR